MVQKKLVQTPKFMSFTKAPTLPQENVFDEFLQCYLDF